MLLGGRVRKRSKRARWLNGIDGPHGLRDQARGNRDRPASGTGAIPIQGLHGCGERSSAAEATESRPGPRQAPSRRKLVLPGAGKALTRAAMAVVSTPGVQAHGKSASFRFSPSTRREGGHGPQRWGRSAPERSCKVEMRYGLRRWRLITAEKKISPERRFRQDTTALHLASRDERIVRYRACQPGTAVTFSAKFFHAPHAEFWSITSATTLTASMRFLIHPTPFTSVRGGRWAAISGNPGTPWRPGCHTVRPCS